MRRDAVVSMTGIAYRTSFTSVVQYSSSSVLSLISDIGLSGTLHIFLLIHGEIFLSLSTAYWNVEDVFMFPRLFVWFVLVIVVD